MKQEERIGNNDFLIDWWVKYVESDEFDRERMVRELPARVDLMRLLLDPEVDEDVKEEISVMSFNSLFGDCVDTCFYLLTEESE